MKKILLFSLFLLVSCGQSDPDGLGSAQPYFWKVEKESQVSYWLGTVHIGVALHEVPCSGVIQEKLKESQLVWTEIGTEKPSKSDILSPNSEDFKSLNAKSQQFLKEKDMPKDLNYITYIGALELLCLQEGLGIQALTTSMDAEVTTMAQLSGIPVQALDDLDTLDNLKKAFTKEDVEQTIKSYPYCREQAKEFVNQYKAGRLPNHTFSGDVLKFLLKDRNEKWLTKFLASYETYSPVFVAVGQAHLAGSANILDMLKEEGFSVQQVSCSH